MFWGLVLYFPWCCASISRHKTELTYSPATYNNNSFAHQVGLGSNYFNAKFNVNVRAAYQYSELDNKSVFPGEQHMSRAFT